MKFTRQHLLLGVLITIILYFSAESLWGTYVSTPLANLEGTHNELQEELDEKRRRIRSMRSIPKRIQTWKRQALPSGTETARSLYRAWLLETIRDADLRSARVDSGTPVSRPGFRIMTFNASARGTLKQITDALFKFENTALLHKIASIRLSPIGDGGQFDLSMQIETIMMARVAAPEKLEPRRINRLVSQDRRAYDIIARDNIFGIAIDHRDPMKMTKLTAVIWRGDAAQIWITEEIEDTVHRLVNGSEFDTTALSGRITEVGEDWVVIETGEQLIRMSIGQSFSEAVVVSGT